MPPSPKSSARVSRAPREHASTRHFAWGIGWDRRPRHVLLAVVLAGLVLSAGSSTAPAATLAPAGSQPSAAPAAATQRQVIRLRLDQRIQIKTATTYRLSGTVSPAHNGARVRIQLRTATGWRTVATVVLRKQTATASQFQATLHNPVTGVYRAQLVATRRYRAANSAVLPVGVSELAIAPAITAALTQERVAAATYANVIARLGKIAPFTNVLASEQEHIATLEALARTYAVSLPAGPFIGEAAPATRVESCRLGVSVERDVIALYDRLLPTVSATSNVARVFTHLKAASQDSHLPAFQHCS